VSEGLPVIVAILNNGYLGMVASGRSCSTAGVLLHVPHEDRPLSAQLLVPGEKCRRTFRIS